MQDSLPSIHHICSLCSQNRTSVSIARFPISPHPQQPMVSKVKSHCFQLCTRRSQPWKSPHIMNILVIDKYRSPVTPVDVGCSQKGRIALIDLFQVFVLEARTYMAVQNPVVTYIFYKLPAEAVTRQMVAGGGVIKHIQGSSQTTTMHWLDVTIL